MSMSPSPSTSVAKTERTSLVAVEITLSAKKGTSAPRAGSAPVRLTTTPASELNTASWLNDASGFNGAANDAAETPDVLHDMASKAKRRAKET